jgi:hypothetical protein
MSNLEFIVTFSLMPIGALIAGMLVYFIARPSRQTRLHPGE